MKQRPRVLLADDHVMVSQGLKMLLEETCDVVETVTDGRALLTAVKRLTPDVVVADISMPILNGIEALRQLRNEGDNTKVIFVTMHSDAQIALEAFRSGATGYVLKHAAGDELIAAIRASLEGRTYLTRLMANSVLHLLLHLIGEQQSQFSGSADSEREMLHMIAEGRTPQDLADGATAQTTSELIHLAIELKLVPRS